MNARASQAFFGRSSDAPAGPRFVIRFYSEDFFLVMDSTRLCIKLLVVDLSSISSSPSSNHKPPQVLHLSIIMFRNSDSSNSRPHFGHLIQCSSLRCSFSLSSRSLFRRLRNSISLRVCLPMKYCSSIFLDFFDFSGGIFSAMSHLLLPQSTAHLLN